MDIPYADQIPTFLGHAVSEHIPIPNVLWFQAGMLSYHGPFDLRLLPPLSDLAAQEAWLAGFTAAWLTSMDPGQEPVDGDAALSAALTRLLQDHRALLAEIMAIPRVAEGGRPH
jgi:hypothetical protein